MIFREFETVLAQHGVTVIDPQGAPFDPAYHEAVAQVPDSQLAPNHVVAVPLLGYWLRDRLLRAAQVVVSKRPEESEGANTAAAEPAADEQRDPGEQPPDSETGDSANG